VGDTSSDEFRRIVRALALGVVLGFLLLLAARREQH